MARFHGLSILSLVLCLFALSFVAADAQTSHYAGVQTTLVSGLSSLSGVAVDTSNTIYVVDEANSRLLKETPSGSGYIQTIITNSVISAPLAAAVDAAGNLYVVGLSPSPYLVRLTPGSGGYTATTIASNLKNVSGVAVNSGGTSLYVTDSTDSLIYQFAYASGSYVPEATVTSGVIAPRGVATDSTGAWYVAAGGNLYKHSATFSATTYDGSIVANGFSPTTNALSLDGADDIFVADTANNRIVEEIVSGSTYTRSVVASNVSGPKGVGVDSNGVIIVADTGDSLAFTQNPSGANFGAVAVASTSAAQSLVFVFDTAGTLNSSVPYQPLVGGVGNLDYAVVTGAGTTCTAGTTFVAGATCTISVDFTPEYAAVRNGAILLNGSAGQQTLAYLTGTGFGPQAAFAATQVTLATEPSGQEDVTVDGAGNVYFVSQTSAEVVKLVYSGGTYTQSSTPIGSGLAHGVAVDGAGNVFVVDSSNNQVIKEVFSQGVYTQSIAIGSNLNSPTRVAVDGAGNLYISDFGNNRVVKEIYSGGTYTQSATAIGSNLHGPYGVAVDAAGNLYIADTYNNRVVKEVYSGGVYTQSTTTIGSGLNSPQGVAVDLAGNVYIAANTRVLKEIPSGSGYTQQAATIGTGLTSPLAVAVDSTGNVYIADVNANVVLLESMATPPSLTFADTPDLSTSADSPKAIVVSNTGSQALTVSQVTVQQNNFTVDASNCLQAAVAAGGSCSLSYSYTPQTLGTHSTLSNVNDNSLNANVHQTVQLSGGTATQAAQTITFPQPASSGDYPNNLTLNLNATSSSGSQVTVSHSASGGLTVTGGNSQIQITGSPGASGTVTLVATQNGNSTYAAASPVTVTFNVTIVSTPPSAASLTDTAVGSSSVATVSVRLTSAGTLGSVLGLAQGAAGLDYSASFASGNCAPGEAVLTNQVCTVTVTFAPRYSGPRYGAVQLLDASGNILGTTLVQANGLGPQMAFAPVETTAASDAYQTKGVAVDGAGNLYVVDSGNRLVKEVYAGGTYTQTVIPTPSALDYPFSVAVDGAGNLYLADTNNDRIVEFANANGTYTESSIINDADAPLAVAVDGAGNLYIVDGGYRLLKEAYAGGTYTETVIPTPSALNSALSVAVDGAGNIYVADTYNNRIVEFANANGTYTESSIVSDAYPPIAVTVDGAGNLYVVDHSSRLLKEVYAGGTYTQTVVPTPIALSYPNSVAVDGAGNIYVADTYNDRIVAETVTTPPTLTFPSTATGVTSAPVSTQVINLGNQSLIFPVPASSTDPQTGANFALETNADTTCPVVNAGGTAGQLAANATCSLSYLFTPTQVGTITSTSVLTDTNLNAAGAMQSITLTGTATQGTQTAQTITFPQPTGTVYPGTATLAATASSGLTVTYTLISGPATLSGSTLTYTGTGTVMVTANQAGSVTYSAAPAVTISITVTQATAFINWSPSTLKIYTGTALGAGVLDATDSIPSTISYSSYLQPSGTTSAVTASTVLLEGSYGLTATFTPQDSLRYGIVSDTLLFTVQNMNVFVANAVGSVSSLYNNGTQQSAATSGGGIGAAVDSTGNVWSINANGNGLTKFTDAGAISGSYSGVAGINAATSLTVDGAGIVWVANGNGTVSAITSSGAAAQSVAIGAAANLSAPASINVDPAGSLWIANSGNNTVTEIIGVAAPVTSPVAQSVVNNTVATRP